MMRHADTTSFTEHLHRLREHLTQVRESGRPLFVTTDGRPEAVVMSPELFDALADKAELLESLALLDRSEADAAAGRTQPLRPALRQIAEELGLKLNR